MNKQVLSIEQMQHLQELGLELKETLLYWARAEDFNQRLKTFHYGKWYLQKGDKAQVVGLSHWEFIPAFTLQDVLDALPGNISYNEKYYHLTVDLDAKNIYYGTTFGFDLLKVFIYMKKVFIIDAAYSLLCWCIENGYIKTEGGE